MRSLRAETLPRYIYRVLQRLVPGALVYVPKVDRIHVQARNAEIRRRRGAGSSVPALAREYNLSASRIWSLCRGIHVGRRGGRRRM